MRFEVKILGSNSAIPSNNRHPTSLCISYHDKAYLIDCGEGTQLQMSIYKVKRSKIEQIFISHLHGDHIFGLPGLLSSFSLQGRKQDLTIFGPIGLKKFVETALEVSESFLPYPLHIKEFEISTNREKIFEDNYLIIYAFPLMHRITTTGYFFEEKQSKIIMDPEAIKRYSLTGSQVKELREGGIVLDHDGNSLSIQNIALGHKPRRTFAYCSDTKYHEDIIEVITGCDLLYHEATFMHDLKELANETMHSTSKEAATIATKSSVKRLLLGHFSSRYKDLNPLLQEAREHFRESYLAIEGETFEI